MSLSWTLKDGYFNDMCISPIKKKKRKKNRNMLVPEMKFIFRVSNRTWEPKDRGGQEWKKEK